MAFLIYYSARHAERETRLRDKASSSMKQQVQEMCPFWLDALSPGLVYYGGDRVRLSAIDSRQSTLGNRLSAIDSQHRLSAIDSRQSTLGNRLSTSTLKARLIAFSLLFSITYGATEATPGPREEPRVTLGIAFDSRQSILGNRLSAIDSRQSTLGNRLSAIDSRQSTLNIDSQG
ncbi:hypothetical protein BDB00DRAFT_925272 [Zychaea mexicana]|uniref:uncharacterized protein n=1 Tax=Zychaea mexicana TaxID=64656 RepID=UPI0022FEBF1D|nr:uncharacterized protein BDB00DRAFT_925272 [Zychaea mexicana]KAI9498519.1 hypothetical protein BDB00DRAFT_925272 [Zychaea mexicana]